MSKSSAITSLFELGEIEHDAPWIDYLSVGLNKENIPALLELLLDPTLQKADVLSNDIWVPQHAWRALGQITDKQAISGIISSFNLLVEDDQARHELPDVMAMIGTAAQPALEVFFLDENNDEAARGIAAQALQNISLKHSDTRQQSIKILTDYCGKLASKTQDLNTLVVCNLLDLQATESIEAIRALYQQTLVDMYAVGDIEDVEIALGLRSERETERPDYGRVHSLNLANNIITQPITTEAEPTSLTDELSHLLAQYGNPAAIQNSSELDGFFASINCAPNTILPSVWQPILWGGEKNLANFPDKKAVNLFTSAAMTFYNQIVRAFSSQTYNALFLESEVANEIVVNAKPWCDGFMRGLNLWAPLISSDLVQQQHLCQPMQSIAEQSTNEHNTKVEDKQLSQIENNTRQLFNLFVTQRAPAPIVKAKSDKMGRNDPCPCGSGKKFKKCCLH